MAEKSMRDLVTVHCPQCRREVQADRTIYLDKVSGGWKVTVYYTCRSKKHHWSLYPQVGEEIPGGGMILPPRGYDEDDR